MTNANVGGVWLSQLLAADFSKECKEDRFCLACLAAFCGLCCADHHRGHEVVRVATVADGGPAVAVRDLPRLAAAPAAVESLVAAAAAEGGHAGAGCARDSFCVECGAAFSAAMCNHHGGHETIRIVLCDGRHCVRCTGSEPWFSEFDGIMTYEDELGHVLVPLHPRGRRAGSAAGRRSGEQES